MTTTIKILLPVKLHGNFTLDSKHVSSGIEMFAKNLTNNIPGIILIPLYKSDI